MTFLMLTFFIQALYGARLTVSGYVSDENTGETIIGVNVMVHGTIKGSATDINGYFTISGLEPSDYVLEFTHIAYEKKSLNLDLAQNSLILPEVFLTPKIVELQGVTIVEEKSELSDLSIETSHRSISARAIRRIPTGRNDVFRAIQFLPGVNATEPFSPLFAVRGGDIGENLILLDGVTIYNPYHFVSSTGLFNVYAIKNVELMVGGFGAEFGGRNSSVLYVSTREGNNQKLHGEIYPSTTHTIGVFDFPVNKNITMMISGRWYYDLFSRFFFNAPNYFYDANISLNWKLNERNRLSLRYFHSRDYVDFKSDTYFNYLGTTFDTDIFDDYDFQINTKWNNQAFSLVLKSIISPSIYWQTQFSGSLFGANNLSRLDFNYETEEHKKIRLFMSSDIQNRIHDYGMKTFLTLGLLDWNTLKFGCEANRYRFENNLFINGYSEGKVLFKPDLLAAFVEDKITLGIVAIKPGIRLTRFQTQKSWKKEMRLNTALYLTDMIKFKFSWGQYLQYIVSLNTQDYEISQYLDNYYPLQNKQPSQSIHTIIGIESTLFSKIHMSLDMYYKDIPRTYTFDYNASQFAASTFFEKIREGRGKAYGFEFLLKGTLGKTSGWMSYGWSRSYRSFTHIMDGKWYAYEYDRPHAFKAVLNYHMNANIDISGSLQILSGMPRTLESGITSYYYYSPYSNAYSIWPYNITPIKNNIRLPYYLRFDLGMKKRVRRGFGAQLAKYLGADKAFLEVTFGNLFFFIQRNVWFYINAEGKLYGIGTNYIPEISAGYSIQF